ncbi:hypothetical protein A3Q32_20900 [Alcanivorax sp. KX64203]|nr:hypothetical protein A3Q32_20900 [Alcanivorax sp. KX64203]
MPALEDIFFAPFNINFQPMNLIFMVLFKNTVQSDAFDFPFKNLEATLPVSGGNLLLRCRQTSSFHLIKNYFTLIRSYSSLLEALIRARLRN